MQLNENAHVVLARRYLTRDAEGNIIETEDGLFRRVAAALAKPDLAYDPDADVAALEKEFYESMGRGSIVIGLAAVIIGEVLCKSLFRRTFSFYVRMAFIALGGVIYYIVIGIVLWLRMPTNDMKLFSAAIVALFLAVPYLKQKRRPHIRKAARETEANRDA